MEEKDVKKTAEQKTADEILHSKGVSSTEQKGATALQNFWGHPLPLLLYWSWPLLYFLGSCPDRERF